MNYLSIAAMVFSSLFIQPVCAEAGFIFAGKKIERDNGGLRVLILNEYMKWQGVRYKYGGNDFNGVDCSALMKRIYHYALSLHIPRTTKEQIHQGEPIDFNDLNVGDLIFFSTAESVRHVGLYIGNDEFVHASVSKGVTISKIDTHYWKTRFITARRILS